MDTLEAFLSNLQQMVWGPPMLLLLFGTGAYMTYVLKGIQFRYIGYAFRELFKPQKNHQKGDISPIAALMTSLSGAIGTGSIVGVATAIAIGGLGSIFWMWVATLFALATKYSESLLAVKYRQVDQKGEMIGGPMYYIGRGLGWKKTAAVFSFLGAVTAIGTGNLVQINAIAEATCSISSLSPWISGLIVSVLTMIIILGGVRSIGHVAVILVPVMALFYIAGGLFVILAHASKIPSAFWLIFSSAFKGQAAAGGFIGSSVSLAIQMGVARSVFSNEAGLGISSISAAAAKTDNPCRQAFLNMTGAIFSTLVICSITGLVIAVTGSYAKVGINGLALSGASLVIEAFRSTLFFGEYVVAIGLILFAFSTIIAWGYYGEKCFEAIFGEKWVIFYRLLYALVILPGAVMKMEVIWTMADISNAFLAIPNLLALIGLAHVVKKETEKFLEPSSQTIST